MKEMLLIQLRLSLSLAIALTSPGVAFASQSTTSNMVGSRSVKSDTVPTNLTSPRSTSSDFSGFGEWDKVRNGGTAVSHENPWNGPGVSSSHYGAGRAGTLLEVLGLNYSPLKPTHVKISMEVLQQIITNPNSSLMAQPAVSSYEPENVIESRYLRIRRFLALLDYMNFGNSLDNVHRYVRHMGPFGEMTDVEFHRSMKDPQWRTQRAILLSYGEAYEAFEQYLRDLFNRGSFQKAALQVIEEVRSHLTNPASAREFVHNVKTADPNHQGKGFAPRALPSPSTEQSNLGSKIKNWVNALKANSILKKAQLLNRSGQSQTGISVRRSQPKDIKIKMETGDWLELKAESLDKLRQQSPIHLLPRLAEKHLVVDLGWQAVSFYTAMYLYGELQTFLHEETKPLDEQRIREMMMNPAFAAVFGGFFVFRRYQLYQQFHQLKNAGMIPSSNNPRFFGDVRGGNIHLTGRVMSPEPKPSYFGPQIPQAPGGISTRDAVRAGLRRFGMLTALIMTTQVLFVAADTFHACHKFNSLEKMSNIKRSQYAQLCQQGWEQWQENLAETYAPMLLSFLGTGAIFSLARVAHNKAAPRVKGWVEKGKSSWTRASERMQAAKANLATNSYSHRLKGRSFITSKMAQKVISQGVGKAGQGARVGFQGVRVVIAGGRSAAYLAFLGGGGPIGVTLAFIEVFSLMNEHVFQPFAMQTNRALGLKSARENLASVLGQAITTDEQFLSEWDDRDSCQMTYDSMDRDDPENVCVHPGITALEKYQQAESKWKQWIIFDTQRALSDWSLSMDRMQQKYLATYYFYRDLHKQVNLASQYTAAYQLPGKNTVLATEDLPDRLNWQDHLYMKAKIAASLDRETLPPLFRSSVDFQTSGRDILHKFYDRDEQNRRTLDKQIRAKDIETKIQVGKLLQENLDHNGLESLVGVKELEETIQGLEKELEKYNAQADEIAKETITAGKTKSIENVVYKIEELLDERSDWVASVSDGLKDILPGFKNPNNKERLAYSIGRLKELTAYFQPYCPDVLSSNEVTSQTLRTGTRGNICVFRDLYVILMQRPGVPVNENTILANIMLPGEVYIKYGVERKLREMGFDTNYYDEETFGSTNGSMGEYLLRQALCGPTPRDGGHNLFDTPAGWEDNFTPPALTDYNVTERFFAPCFDNSASAVNYYKSESPQYTKTLLERFEQWNGDKHFRQSKGKLSLFDQILFDMKLGVKKGYVAPGFLLLDRIKPEIRDNPFEAWWAENVEPAFVKALQIVEEKYHTKVIQEKFIPAVNRTGSATLTDEKVGLKEAFERQVDFLVDDVLLPLLSTQKYSDNTVARFPIGQMAQELKMHYKSMLVFTGKASPTDSHASGEINAILNDLRIALWLNGDEELTSQLIESGSIPSFDMIERPRTYQLFDKVLNALVGLSHEIIAARGVITALDNPGAIFADSLIHIKDAPRGSSNSGGSEEP